jgi:hypothetical protein
MYNLPRLSLADMVSASSVLRKLGGSASSMEEVAQAAAGWFFDEFGDADSAEPGSVLARVYKTQRMGQLPPDLQDVATRSSAEPLEPWVRCLVLLGTMGVEKAWCARQGSHGHRAIPLPSPEAVARLPMVAGLVAQLGIDVAGLVTPSPGLLMDASEHRYNVFHVETAQGSAFIPAQDFVRAYGVRSVLGFGGLLPDGDLYAAILFSRCSIGRETAEAFKPLTLALKLALLPFKADRVFRGEPRGS